MLRGSRAFSGKIHLPFLAQVVPPFTTRVSGGDTWRWRLRTRVSSASGGISRRDPTTIQYNNKVRGVSYQTTLPVHQTASRSLYADMNEKGVDHLNQPAFNRLYGERGHVVSHVRIFSFNISCLYLMKRPTLHVKLCKTNILVRSVPNIFICQWLHIQRNCNISGCLWQVKCSLVEIMHTMDHYILYW